MDTTYHSGYPRLVFSTDGRDVPARLPRGTRVCEYPTVNNPGAELWLFDRDFDGHLDGVTLTRTTVEVPALLTRDPLGAGAPVIVALARPAPGVITIAITRAPAAPPVPTAPQLPKPKMRPAVQVQHQGGLPSIPDLPQFDETAPGVRASVRQLCGSAVVEELDPVPTMRHRVTAPSARTLRAVPAALGLLLLLAGCHRAPTQAPRRNASLDRVCVEAAQKSLAEDLGRGIAARTAFATMFPPAMEARIRAEIRRLSVEGCGL